MLLDGLLEVGLRRAFRANFQEGSSMADAFDDFNFKVKWDGRFIAGVSKVSALVRSTEVVEHREGGSSISVKSPGQTKYDPITLERGRTSDAAFEDWANLIPGVPLGGVVVAGGAFRKNVLIDVYDGAGRLVMSYQVFHCWPSRYETLSALSGDDNDTAVEQLTLEHDGWERDTSVVVPASAP
jgi:phage tail-like protein